MSLVERCAADCLRRGALRMASDVQNHSKIGSKGGSTVREHHGSAFYTQIGRRGGETTKRNLGTEHYSRIGRIGGKHAHGRRPESSASEPDAPLPERIGDERSPSD